MDKKEEDQAYLKSIVLDLLLVTLDYMVMNLSERRKKMLRLQLLDAFFSQPAESTLTEIFTKCHDFLCDRILQIEERTYFLKKENRYSGL